MYAVIIAIVIILVLFAWYISTNNSFKRAKIKVGEAQSGIEVALTKRHDTLTKLLDIAKGYMQHEQDTFAQVIQMRKGMNLAELNEASRQMDAIASSINVTAEAYPELRSSEVFSELQRSIADVEEHLQAARRLYNANVSHFNTMKEVFPSSIIGKNYESYEFFQADESSRADVKMSF